jgi:hypothetical protein
MFLLTLDPNYQDLLTVQDFKLLVETLVDCGLLCLVDFDAGSLSSVPPVDHLSPPVPITFSLQLEDVESTIEKTLLTDVKYKRLVKKMKGIIM